MIVIAQTLRANLSHTFGLLAAAWMATLLGQGCSLSSAETPSSSGLAQEVASFV